MSGIVISSLVALFFFVLLGITIHHNLFVFQSGVTDSLCLMILTPAEHILDFLKIMIQLILLFLLQSTLFIPTLDTTTISL